MSVKSKRYSVLVQICRNAACIFVFWKKSSDYFFNSLEPFYPFFALLFSLKFVPPSQRGPFEIWQNGKLWSNLIPPFAHITQNVMLVQNIIWHCCNFFHFILMDWMAIDSFIFSPATFRREICSKFSFNFLN